MYCSLEHVTTADVHFRDSPDSIIEAAASAQSMNGFNNGDTVRLMCLSRLSIHYTRTECMIWNYCDDA